MEFLDPLLPPVFLEGKLHRRAWSKGWPILFLFTKQWVLMSCTCYVLRGLSTRRRDNRRGLEAVRTSSEHQLARN